MLGNQRGTCKNILLESGESIKAMLVRYDDNVIRNIEFKKSDGEIIKMGDYVNPPTKKPLWHHVINIESGQDIIGVFGRVEDSKPKDGGVPSSHFISIGFFVNKCDNPQLEKISHDRGPPADIQKKMAI